MDTNKFLGFELPNDIGYEVYANHVVFYKKNEHNEWNQIGNIIKPNAPQPLTWWKEQLDNALKK